jgi:hypothetical protein
MNTEHKYDIAISFAGEQRDIAEAINNRLKQHNIRTFYDEDKAVDLWGKNLAEYLPTIYSDDAKFVLIILSKEYLKKVWTKVERRAAVSRLIRSDYEYLLIYKIGDVDTSNIPGISPDISYLSDKQASAEVVSKGILSKLGLSYTNEEIYEIASKFTYQRIKQEHFEEKFINGVLPYITVRDELYQEYPGIGERLGHFQKQYLDEQVNNGVFFYVGGMVIGYKLNPEEANK